MHNNYSALFSVTFIIILFLLLSEISNEITLHCGLVLCVICPTLHRHPRNDISQLAAWSGWEVFTGTSTCVLVFFFRFGLWPSGTHSSSIFVHLCLYLSKHFQISILSDLFHNDECWMNAMEAKRQNVWILMRIIAHRIHYFLFGSLSTSGMMRKIRNGHLRRKTNTRMIRRIVLTTRLREREGNWER